MTERKAFRVKRAQENLLQRAREWSEAWSAWRAYPGFDPEDDRLYDVQRAKHERVEAAAHELVAVESEPES